MAAQQSPSNRQGAKTIRRSRLGSWRNKRCKCTGKSRVTEARPHAKRHTLQQPSWDRCVSLHASDHAVYNSSLAARPAATDAGPSIACWVSLIERLCLSLGAQRSSGSEASGTASPLG